jgi:energy-converting hydrogenase Eha subunit C
MVTSVSSPATASRGLQASPLQRISEIVLIAGTVGAVVAASGTLWIARLGVAIAIVAALLACAFAWRELNTARRTQAQAMLKATREHGEALSEERTRNAAVVETLSGRISDARKVIEKQRVIIARERQQIGTLKEDRAYLMGEVDYRQKVISSLRETVREREAELIALHDEPDAQVHHMPRRVLAEHEFIWQQLSDDDEIIDGLQPRVVDIKIIDMVLPNYESDRQPA